MFPILTDEGADAMRDVMTAVNGFYYPGARADAIYITIAWLQAHPEARAALFKPLLPEVRDPAAVAAREHVSTSEETTA
jgi:hypothetical protein